VEFNNSEAKFGRKALLEKRVEEFAKVVNPPRKIKIKEIKIKEALTALTQLTRCLCVLDMLAQIFLSRSSSYV